jgi:GR25 family glycosyltransferase involved in LPS biosynthesis
MRYLLFLLGTLLVLIAFHVYFSRGAIVSAHVINMASSRDRYTQFMKHAGTGELVVTRWDAVNGKTLSADQAAAHGITPEIYKTHAAQARLGVIGCYLSHSTLLAHLGAQRHGPNDTHLIFEDDVVLPENYDMKIRQIIDQLPADWDILQLFTLDPVLKPWKGAIKRPDPSAIGNWSTAAYAVRHGALGKINNHVRIMRVPIDNQLLEKCGTWNWFSLQPDLVKINDGGKTTLNDK